MGIYGSNYAYGQSPFYKDDTEYRSSRHYPRLVQLGQYAELFPKFNGFESNVHFKLKLVGIRLDDVDDDAIDLFNEIFPITATSAGLIDNWEILAGIPKDNLLSIDQRRNGIVASLRARGALSVSYFKLLAAGLGYNYGSHADPPRIVFFEGDLYKAFRANYGKAGDEVWSQDEDHHEHLVTVTCDNVATDAELQRVFTRLRPVGITFKFNYF